MATVRLWNTSTAEIFSVIEFPNSVCTVQLIQSEEWSPKPTWKEGKWQFQPAQCRVSFHHTVEACSWRRCCCGEHWGVTTTCLCPPGPPGCWGWWCCTSEIAVRRQCPSMHIVTLHKGKQASRNTQNQPDLGKAFLRTFSTRKMKLLIEVKFWKNFGLRNCFGKRNPSEKNLN